MSNNPYQFPFRYVCTFKLSFRSRRVGETPTGLATDVQLSQGKVITLESAFERSWSGKPTRPPDLEALNGDQHWHGLAGSVVSWSDSVVLRRDAVTEFSGRATLQTVDEEPCLIGVVFQGCSDAAPARAAKDFLDPKRDSSADYDDLRRGDSRKELPVQLSVKFEGGQPPPAWAATGQYSGQLNQWMYRYLFRHYFVARGMVKFDSKGDPASAWFHIWGPAKSAFELEDFEKDFEKASEQG